MKDFWILLESEPKSMKNMYKCNVSRSRFSRVGVLVGGGGVPGRVLPLGTAGHDLSHLGLSPLVGLQRDRADQAARQLQEGVHPNKSDDRHLGARPEHHHVSPAPVGLSCL